MSYATGVLEGRRRAYAGLIGPVKRQDSGFIRSAGDRLSAQQTSVSEATGGYMRSSSRVRLMPRALILVNVRGKKPPACLYRDHVAWGAPQSIGSLHLSRNFLWFSLIISHVSSADRTMPPSVRAHCSLSDGDDWKGPLPWCCSTMQCPAYGSVPDAAIPSWSETNGPPQPHLTGDRTASGIGGYHLPG